LGGTVFTIPEVLRLAELGKFTLVSAETTLDASLADANRPGSKATVVSLSVNTNEKLVTERYNWGGTSISNKVYYELHWEKGIYCGNAIRQSNQENHCTHLVVASFIDVYLWNISSPAQDVFVDFSCWYYTFPRANEDEILDIYFKRDRLLEEIRDTLLKLVPSPPPPAPSQPPEA
jgi:hypothetical protein